MTGIVSATEAATTLGIARRTLLNRVERGEIIPAQKMPGRTGAYLFDAEQIAYLADHPDAKRVPGGDVCGCPDDRCVGRHHDADVECPCARSLAAEAVAR